MTTPEERDFIGEVIREDAADRTSNLTLIACKVDESCGQKIKTERFGIVPDRVYGHDKFGPVCKDTEGEIYVREKAFNELRQQLADVSHERDLLRGLLKRVIDYSVLAFEQDGPEQLELLEADICAALKSSAEVKS